MRTNQGLALDIPRRGPPLAGWLCIALARVRASRTRDRDCLIVRRLPSTALRCLLDDAVRRRADVQRFFSIPLDRFDTCQVPLRLVVTGVGGQCGLVRRGRRLEAPGVLQRHAQVVVKCRYVVPQLHGPGEQRQRLVCALHLEEQQSEMNELDAWSMNNLGLLLLETKRADEALPLLAKAVELRQGVPSFHNNLGMALEHTGRFKAAAAAYKAALTVDPGYDKAKRNLARVEAVQGNADEPLDVGSPANGVVEKTAKGGAGKTPNN